VLGEHSRSDQGRIITVQCPVDDLASVAPLSARAIEGNRPSARASFQARQRRAIQNALANKPGHPGYFHEPVSRIGAYRYQISFGISPGISRW